MQSTARLNIAGALLLPRDLWRWYKNVVGDAAEAAPDVLPALTNDQMSALSDVIDMGPFDALEILPLITADGTTASLEVIGYAGAVNPGADGSPSFADCFANGVAGIGWLGESLARISCATPTADVGDLTPLFGSNVADSDLAFTANTLTATPTQAPAVNSVKGNVTARLSTAGVIRVRAASYQKMRVLVTAVSATGDTVRVLVRRVRVESDA